MKKLLILVLALVLITGVFGEVKAEWAETIRIFANSIVQSIKQTEDGGFILLAHHSNPYINYWLVKLDSNGGVEWEKTYGLKSSSGTDLDDRPDTVQQTIDGGYILVGNSNRNRTWIIKVDKFGGIEWQKIGTYHSFESFSFGGETVKQTNDGGYVIGDQPNLYGASDFGLMKLNSDGSFAWRAAIGNNGWNQLMSIDLTNDGGYLLAGRHGDAPNTKFGIVKLNSNGIVQWQKQIDDSVPNTNLGLQLAITTSDGGFVVGGSVLTWNSWINNVYLLKNDANGNILWQKKYFCYGDDYISDIKEMPDGGYVFVGFTSDNSGYYANKLWIVRIDSFGNIIWDKIYFSGMKAISIDLTKDGGFIIGGGKLLPFSPFEDAFVMRLNQNGDIPGCTVIKKEGLTGSMVMNGAISDTNFSHIKIETPSITDTYIAPITTSSERTYLCFVSNHIPSVNAGPDLVITSQDKNSTIINGLANDEDIGDQLQYRWLENNSPLQNWLAVGSGGQCPLSLSSVGISLGSHVLRLEVFDGGETNFDDMNLVVGNTAPYIALSGGGVYEFNSDVFLNATISDYDGDLITYKWTDGFATFCSGTIQTISGGSPVPLPFCNVNNLALGNHVIALEVSDGVNGVGDDIQVDIKDGTAPKLARAINTNLLWPPNHKMVDIVIQANAVDNGGGSIILSAEVRSNEPEDGLGDGDTAPDWTAVEINQQTGVLKLQLRAERGGGGNGREYTITITAMDSSGNISSTDLKVVVPHDKRTK